MRLLVLTGGLERETLDPAASWMWELCAKLSERGHRVSVLCTRAPEPGESAETPPGVNVVRAAGESLAPALRAALDAQPDVVHVALTGPLSASAAALLEGAPVLLDLVDWSPLCPAGDLLTRPRGEECAQHPPHAPCGSCVGHAQWSAMQPLLALARAGHRVVAHTAYVRDRATLALGRGVAWVPVGVDTARFKPVPAAALSCEVASLASAGDRPRVLLLGPPTPGRGGGRVLDLLLALQARVPGVELVVPGTDPGDPDAQHMVLAEAKELGLASQLRSFPLVPHGDLPALLAACEVAVAPGLAPEPLGLSIVQALACGVPIVAHPGGAVPALLDSGRAGQLVGAGALGLFADAVAELLADPGQRASLSEQARLAAIERHELERVVFDTEALYERVSLPRGQRFAGPSRPPRRAAA